MIVGIITLSITLPNPTTMITILTSFHFVTLLGQEHTLLPAYSFAHNLFRSHLFRSFAFEENSLMTKILVLLAPTIGGNLYYELLQKSKLKEASR